MYGISWGGVGLPPSPKHRVIGRGIGVWPSCAGAMRSAPAQTFDRPQSANRRWGHSGPQPDPCDPPGGGGRRVGGGRSGQTIAVEEAPALGGGVRCSCPSVRRCTGLAHASRTSRLTPLRRCGTAVVRYAGVSNDAPLPPPPHIDPQSHTRRGGAHRCGGDWGLLGAALGSLVA